MVTKNCPVCKESLEDIDSKCCGKESCLHYLEERVTGNEVTEFVQSKKDISLLHFNFALKALRSTPITRAENVYEPFPSRFLTEADKKHRFKMSVLTGRKLNKNFPSLLSLLDGYTNTSLVKLIEKFDTDQQLYDVIGQDLYSWCKFTLSTVITRLNKTEIKKDNQVILEIYEPDHQSWNTTFANTEVKFHGSKEECWYSILRNGLQVLSRTSMMTAGAAYGNGIYSADCITTSQGYGSWIAVCWVDSRYFNSNRDGITVIGRGEAIQIKGLFHISSALYSAIPNMRDLSTLLKQRYALISPAVTLNPTINSKRNRRLHKERIALEKEKEISLDINDDEALTCWQVTVVDDESLGKVGGKIVLEFHFGPQYPINAPFCRMISPRFKPLTGHITQGGAICMHELSSDGWLASLGVFGVVQLISKVLIQQGNGEIHPTNQRPYDLQEAQDSFQRLKREHGWF